MVDFLRGVAIVNIIFIHTIWWGGRKHFPIPLVRQLSLLVDVPLFFYLSGWVLADRLVGWRGLVRRIAGLYVQFLLVVAILALVTTCVSGNVDWRLWVRWAMLEELKSEPLAVVMGSMWFLPVYFQVLAAATLIKSGTRSLSVLAIMVSLLPALLVMFERGMFLGGSPELFGGATIRYVVFYLFFFLLGTLGKQVPVPAAALMGLSAVPVLFVIMPILRHQPLLLQNNKFPPSHVYGICSLASVLLATAMIRGQARLLSHLPEKLVSFFSFSGRRSYSIFLYQGIGCSLPYFSLPPFRGAELPWGWALPAIFALNLAVTYLLVFLMAAPSQLAVRMVNRAGAALEDRLR